MNGAKGEENTIGFIVFTSIVNHKAEHKHKWTVDELLDLAAHVNEDQKEELKNKFPTPARHKKLHEYELYLTRYLCSYTILFFLTTRLPHCPPESKIDL